MQDALLEEEGAQVQEGFDGGANMVSLKTSAQAAGRAQSAHASHNAHQVRKAWLRSLRRQDVQ